MKTIKLKTFLSYIKDDALKQFAKDLVKDGFTLIHNKLAKKYAGKSGITHFNYSKDNKIGYIQQDHFGFYTLSSSYKPSPDNGTGARYEGEFWELDTDTAYKAMSTQYPEPNKPRPVFYKDLDEYLNGGLFKEDKIIVN